MMPGYESLGLVGECGASGRPTTVSRSEEARFGPCCGWGKEFFLLSTNNCNRLCISATLVLFDLLVLNYKSVWDLMHRYCSWVDLERHFQNKTEFSSPPCWDGGGGRSCFLRLRWVYIEFRSEWLRRSKYSSLSHPPLPFHPHEWSARSLSASWLPDARHVRWKLKCFMVLSDSVLGFVHQIRIALVEVLDFWIC